MECVGSGERAGLWGESILSWWELSLPAQLVAGVGDTIIAAWLRCLCSLGTNAAMGLAARSALGRLAAHPSSQLVGEKGAPDADTLPMEITSGIQLLYCLMVNRDVRWSYKKAKVLVTPQKANVFLASASAPWIFRQLWLARLRAAGPVCMASRSEDRVKFSLYATVPPEVMESRLFFRFSLDRLGNEIFNLNWPTLVE